MWTKKDLKELIKDKLKDYLLVIASNRQPYWFNFKKGKIICQRGAGGVVTALDPVMRSCGGIWVAAGLGDADRKIADKEGKLNVPLENPKYLLRLVWLTKEEEGNYYYGYANQAIWPLCHMVYVKPHFDTNQWEHYKQVNKKFADAIINEVGDRKTLVWIQDYHLALVAKYLKEKNPNIITSHFWHIPWPNPEIFRILPQRKEMLEGLLANDLLGFHIRYHCDNFMACVDKELECRIDREHFVVTRGGHNTSVKPFPISIDFEETSSFAHSKEVEEKMEELKEEFDLSGYEHVLIGLDRVDYTKGIPEKIKAVDKFLDKYPDMKEKFVFLQMGGLSRIHIPTYKNLNDQINSLVEEINWKHSTDTWSPIKLVRRYLGYIELLALFRLGDVCIVSSLHDGMNLVSKEYVSARFDLKGMLLLSQFTGAARELNEAMLINPYDLDEFADSIKKALDTSLEEKKRILTKMRQAVKTDNIYRWAGKVLSQLLKFEFKEE